MLTFLVISSKRERPQKVVLFPSKQNLRTPSYKDLRQLLHPEICSSSAAVSYRTYKILNLKKGSLEAVKQIAGLFSYVS